MGEQTKLNVSKMCVDMEISQLYDETKEIIISCLEYISANENEVSYEQIEFKNAVEACADEIGFIEEPLEEVADMDEEDKKSVLLCCMEYMYLKDCTEDSYEEYEDFIDEFDIGNKTIKKMKKEVEEIYQNALETYQEAEAVQFSDKEKEILVSCLYYISNFCDYQLSDEQREFAHLIIADWDNENMIEDLSGELSSIEEEEKKNILRCCMEFIYLKDCTEDNYEEYEDFIDEFDIGNKTIKKIKREIEELYDRKGCEGFFGKYKSDRDDVVKPAYKCAPETKFKTWFDVKKELVEEKTCDDDSLYESIETACEVFIMEHNENAYQVTNKLISNLDIPCDEIYLAHDDTMFKSGKNGFAITRNGIYCRDFMGNYTNRVSFKELAEAEDIYVEDNYIYADNEKIAYITGTKDIYDLQELFEEIAGFVKWGV